MTLKDYLIQFKTVDNCKLLEVPLFYYYAVSWDVNVFSEAYCNCPYKEAGFYNIFEAFKQYCDENHTLYIEDLPVNNFTDDNRVILQDGCYKKLNLTYNASTYELINPENDED